MKEDLDDNKLKTNRCEIRFLTILLLITLLLHVFFSIISSTSDADLFRFVRRSNAVLDGKVSYRDEELISDPKPFWTYFLALWLFFCRLIAGFFLNLEDPSLYDLEYTKSLLIIVNLMMIVLIFYASKDMFSIRAAYFASCFYAINLFTLLLCSVAGKYDVLPAFFALFAVWMATRIKIGLSATFLSFGTIFKYIAVLPLPIILIFLWKKERNQRMIFKYLAIFSIICIFTSIPFLLIDAEKFLDSTLLFFLTRKEHGVKSYYHPYYHIPSQFLFIFPSIFLTLICIYALRKENISNYNFIMLIFIEISLIVFTNKTLLEQYFFYAIPYLALAFPNILLKEGKVDISSEDIAPVTAAIILPNLFAYDYLRLFIFVRESSFNNFKLSKLFDYHVRYEIIGNVDGRPFIICFILVIYLSLNYILKNQKYKLQELRSCS